jgi:hypothetical protein
MEHIATLANGKKVYADLTGSHLATHFADFPELSNLVKDFLATQSFTEPLVYADYDMGKVVGNSDLVETSDSDEIVYAKRLNRDTYTRFVKGRDAVPTSYITISLHQDSDGNYELSSAWIGQICPLFPDRPGATAESKSFWTNHALVWGNQTIQEGTETTVSPWD